MAFIMGAKFYLLQSEHTLIASLGKEDALHLQISNRLLIHVYDLQVHFLSFGFTLFFFLVLFNIFSKGTVVDHLYHYF